MVNMDPITQDSQPRVSLESQVPPKRGFVGFIRKHWFLLFLAAFATLLMILWLDSRSRRAEKLPNLPQITYPRLPGQNITASIRVTLPTTQVLPAQTSSYQVERKSLSRDQARALASNLAFPKEPSNISTDVVLGDYYIWLSGAQTLSIRLSPVEIKMIPDSFVSSPPSDGSLPSEKAGFDFISNLLSLNGLSSRNIDYTKVTSRPVFEENVLEINITPTIDGVPVIDINPTTPLVSGYLQKDGKLFGLIYRSGFDNMTNTVSYPTKTLKQVQDSLVVEGKIITLGEPQSEPALLIPTAINVSTITPSLLFVSEKPEMLLPIYVLTGVAQTEQGQVPVYIYIPSVNSKYVRAL